MSRIASPLLETDLLPAFLSFDSSLEPAPDQRSGPGDIRVLVFADSRLSLELEVMADHVVGQVVPPGTAEIWVETPGGHTVRVAADDSGFFDLPGLPPSPFRVRCEAAAGQLLTGWVRT